MKINSVVLIDKQLVLLLEDFFETDFLEKLTQLFEQHTKSPDWIDAEWTSCRRIYCGNDPVYLELLKVLSSPTTLTPIEQALGKKIKFDSVKLWADYPGFGPLQAHQEGSGQGQAQIYITRKEHATNGTSILNNDKQLLFTLPYRNNYGWYFDDCTKVMHSREFDVPVNTVRYSLIFWYSYETKIY
jgi:hypothetical protein